MKRMWIRKPLDISSRDLLRAMGFCFQNSCPIALIQAIQSMWELENQKTLVCLSVRTGFDLLFRALHFEQGAEILFSALTIPDMPEIIRHHGLVPVPLDIDEDTLAPTPDHVEAAITNKTKAIVIAHLHGGIHDLTDICRIAKKHSVMVIEDCAQAFYSRTYCGDSSADISMFSFGTIKTITALGGGVLIVRNNQILYDRMSQIHRSYPAQSKASFFIKILKYFLLTLIMNPVAFAWVVSLLKTLRVDHDALVHSLSKSFAGGDFFDKIRKFPSAPLLRLMMLRLKTFSQSDIEERIGAGNYVLQRLPAHCAFPGRKSAIHSFWVFPVLVRDPGKVIRSLRQAGFDATQRHSLKIVEIPGNKTSLSVAKTEAMIRRMIYLPLYKQMPMDEIDRMTRHLAAAD